MTAFRTKLANLLATDGVLLGYLGANRVVQRPRRGADIAIPSLTYFDFNARPDPTVPLLELTVQLDFWERTLKESTRDARRAEELLDKQPWGELPGGEMRVDTILLQLERPGPDADNGDIAQLTQQYRVQAYQLI